MSGSLGVKVAWYERIPVKAYTILELNLPNLLQRKILSVLNTLDEFERALYNHTSTYDVQYWKSPDIVLQPGTRTEF